MNENDMVIKDARTLGLPKMLLLGLQHMFAMFGATILVPILVNTYFEGEGLSIQVTLMCAGLGTLFFHACSKLKVPAFLGSSFAFLGGFATVANLDSGIFADMTMGEKLPYACGGIVVAGALYLILALIIKLAGVERVMHYLPPVVTGPIIICIGLSLAPSAIANASTNWLIALIALGTIIGGVSFMLYGMISAIGVRNVVENQVDLTKSRNLVIAAVILVCGLGFSDGLTFEAAGTSVTLTGLAIAAIAGVLLNVILPGNDYQFGKNLQGDINRGVAINPNPKKRQE